MGLKLNDLQVESSLVINGETNSEFKYLINFHGMNKDRECFKPWLMRHADDE